MGVPGDQPGTPPVVARDWLADPARWAGLRGQLAEVVAAHVKRDPLAIGMPPEAARAALGLPDRALVDALAQDAASSGGRVQLQDGYLRIAPSLPPPVVAGVRAVLADLEAAPFLAPDAARLRDLGLDPRAIAAAARAGLLLRVTEQIVLAPDAAARAARVLAGLPQPFTAAEARQALGTTRRVAIPLLEYLDRAGITQRLPDDRRRLRLILAGGSRRDTGDRARAGLSRSGPAGGPAGRAAGRPPRIPGHPAGRHRPGGCRTARYDRLAHAARRRRRPVRPSGPAPVRLLPPLP
jgi:selenocysteine-specific elongation factor